MAHHSYRPHSSRNASDFSISRIEIGTASNESSKNSNAVPTSSLIISATPRTAENWLQTLAFAWNQLI
jgi:hypothetical protein